MCLYLFLCLCFILSGDGANDMSALRAATVGVSLCEAETSVAAPITSMLQVTFYCASCENNFI